MSTRNLLTVTRTLMLVATVGCMLIVAIGCSKEESAQPVVKNTAPPPPPAPAKPKVTPVADLMAQLGIDERVSLSEDQAPKNNEDRVALLTFFDGMVRGDQQTVSDMLPMTDREQLQALVDSGQWSKTADDIYSVELYTGKDPDFGEDVVLAIYTVGFDLQPQMWAYDAKGGDYVFDAVPGPSNILDKISGNGDELITAWFEYNRWEMNELANRPDEKLEIEQRNVAKGHDDSSSSKTGSPAPSPSGPAAPGGGKRRRPIPKTPRKPPGPG